MNCWLVSGFCSLVVSKRCFFFSPVFAFLSFSASFPINRLWSLPISASLLVLTSCRERLFFSIYKDVIYLTLSSAIWGSPCQLMYCLMLEECPSNHEVILPTYVTQSAAVISHCIYSVFAHDPFPVNIVAPNSCIEIPKNH